MSVLALPERPELLRTADAAQLERLAAQLIPAISDMAEAQEKRRQADALEAYFQGTEAHPHMQGIARRVEARIGELLGPADEARGGRGKPSVMGEGLGKDLRSDFRALASKVRRGLLKYEMDGDDSPWRASRRALLLGVGAFSGEATGQYEWYTPAEFVKSARSVMGGIDLDPASTAEANEVVGARRYFTEQDNGLVQSWAGRVWMNPPYAHPLVEEFCAKLCEEYLDGGVTQAVTLTYAATETGWFHTLADAAEAIAFPRGRVPYWSSREGGSAPLKGSALFYLGSKADKFRDVFEAHGITVLL